MKISDLMNRGNLFQQMNELNLTNDGKSKLDIILKMGYRDFSLIPHFEDLSNAEIAEYVFAVYGKKWNSIIALSSIESPFYNLKRITNNESTVNREFSNTKGTSSNANESNNEISNNENTNSLKSFQNTNFKDSSKENSSLSSSRSSNFSNSSDEDFSGDEQTSTSGSVVLREDMSPLKAIENKTYLNAITLNELVIDVIHLITYYII